MSEDVLFSGLTNDFSGKAREPDPRPRPPTGRPDPRAALPGQGTHPAWFARPVDLNTRLLHKKRPAPPNVPAVRGISCSRYLSGFGVILPDNRPGTAAFHRSVGIHNHCQSVADRRLHCSRQVWRQRPDRRLMTSPIDRASVSFSCESPPFILLFDRPRSLSERMASYSILPCSGQPREGTISSAPSSDSSPSDLHC